MLITQSIIFSPILFNIYTADQPTTSHTSVADFADDKAIYISEKNPHLASQHLQNHLNLLADWYSKWRIKINDEKSSHITFTLKQSTVPPV